jgi:hypothetical protein
VAPEAAAGLPGASSCTLTTGAGAIATATTSPRKNNEVRYIVVVVVVAELKWLGEEQMAVSGLLKLFWPQWH